MILETNRLMLRPWSETDATDLFVQASHPEVGPARVGLFIRAWKKVERLSRQSLANPKPMPLFTKKKDR